MDPCLSSMTPAVSLLTRCVSRGLVSQEQIDSASSTQSPAFSSHLQEAEQRIRLQRQLDEVSLQVSLLQVEQQSADVTHRFYLTGRLQVLQVLCNHLQDILKEQTKLRQRLMRSLGRTNLPIHAPLHRHVLDVVKMLMDFIRTLEEKLSSVRNCPAATEQLTQMDSSVNQLLAQVAEVESLSNQLLQWKEVGSGHLSDSSG